jgi:hypothetical protein
MHFHFWIFLSQLRKVAHSGCVNRIRAMIQNPNICASWSDAGYVQVRLLCLPSKEVLQDSQSLLFLYSHLKGLFDYQF